MKKNVNIRWIFTLAVLSVLVSCKDSYTICDQNRTSTANGNFYSISGGVETENRPASLTIGELNGGNTIINSPFPTSFSLILVPNRDSMSFTVRTSGTAPIDTIKLRYATTTTILSENCGAISQYQLRSISTTTNTIDSIRIINPLADQLLGNNFRIFY